MWTARSTVFVGYLAGFEEINAGLGSSEAESMSATTTLSLPVQPRSLDLGSWTGDDDEERKGWKETGNGREEEECGM